VKPYRIVYRLRKQEKVLEILRVWHGAKGEPEAEVERLLRRRLELARQ
jgi:hypothetical protein